MSWASVGSPKLSRAIAVKNSSLRHIGRSPSSRAGGARKSVGNATPVILLLNEGPVARPHVKPRAISHNAQYGTRFEVFGKCSSRLMESCRAYSVKVAL